MRIVESKDKGFEKLLSEILKRGDEDTSSVEEAVKEIIFAVRSRGDDALVEYTRRFDKADVKGRLEVKPVEIDKAIKSVPKADIKLLELASDRIESFHRGQVENSWFTTDRDGTILGARVTPLGWRPTSSRRQSTTSSHRVCSSLHQMQWQRPFQPKSRSRRSGS